MSLTKWFKFKYPKITLLVIIIVASYIFFTQPSVQEYFSNLETYGYLSIFIAGLFYAFGFTTPIGIGIFLVTSVKSILLASIIGGLGSMIGDLIIFQTIRISFMNEFNQLERIRLIKRFEKFFKKNFSRKIIHYLLFVFAGLILISPLPDELGVSLLAGFTRIKPVKLALISFVVNGLGVALFISIGRII